MQQAHLAAGVQALRARDPDGPLLPGRVKRRAVLVGRLAVVIRKSDPAYKAHAVASERWRAVVLEAFVDMVGNTLGVLRRVGVPMASPQVAERIAALRGPASANGAGRVLSSTLASRGVAGEFGQAVQHGARCFHAIAARHEVGKPAAFAQLDRRTAASASLKVGSSLRYQSGRRCGKRPCACGSRARGATSGNRPSCRSSVSRRGRWCTPMSLAGIGQGASERRDNCRSLPRRPRGAVRWRPSSPRRG